jgi:hypothetical protein
VEASYRERDSAKASAAHGFHSLTTCFFSRGAETVRFGNFQLSGSGASKRLGRHFFSLLDFGGDCFLWNDNDVDL